MTAPANQPQKVGQVGRVPPHTQKLVNENDLKNMKQHNKNKTFLDLPRSLATPRWDASHLSHLNTTYPQPTRKATNHV